MTPCFLSSFSLAGSGVVFGVVGAVAPVAVAAGAGAAADLDEKEDTV